MLTLRILLTFSISLLLLISTSAQQAEYFHIQGVVKDRETHEPLPFANITVAGASLGGTTNKEGRFLFKIPIHYREDTLKVTYMGYHVYKEIIKNIAGKELTIELRPSRTLLHEAIIEPEDASQLLKEAVGKIAENYWNQSAALTFFYRGKTTSNDEFIEYSEGVFKLFKQEDKSSLQMVKGRQSICRAIFDQMSIDLTLKSSYFKYADFVHHLDETAILSKEGFKNHNFWLDGITNWGDHKVYKISFEQNDRKKRKAYYEGKIYVDVATKAIVHIDFSYDSHHQQHAEVWEGKSKLMAMFMGVSADIDRMRRQIYYRQYQGKWILDKSIHHFAYDISKNSPSINSLLQVDAEYLVTEVEPLDRQLPDQGVGKRENVFKGFSGFQEDFWEEHNIIEESKEVQQILKEIEQQKKIYQRDTTEN